MRKAFIHNHPCLRSKSSSDANRPPMAFPRSLAVQACGVRSGGDGRTGQNRTFPDIRKTNAECRMQNAERGRDGATGRAARTGTEGTEFTFQRVGRASTPGRRGRENIRPLYIQVVWRGCCWYLAENWGFGKIRGIFWGNIDAPLRTRQAWMQAQFGGDDLMNISLITPVWRDAAPFRGMKTVF